MFAKDTTRASEKCICRVQEELKIHQQRSGPENEGFLRHVGFRERGRISTKREWQDLACVALQLQCMVAMFLVSSLCLG